MVDKDSSIYNRRIFTILVVCLAIPLIASWFIVRYVTGDIFYEQKRSNLTSIARMLDTQLGEGGYDEILEQAGAKNATRDEQIAVLNEALKVATDKVASVGEGLGVGFYSKELDAIITYGPSEDFLNTIGQSIAEDHPGREVMATNTPMVSQGTMVRGNIMNAMVPVERSGEVIGYIWANELISDLEATLNSTTLIISSLLVLAYIIMLVIVVIFFRRLMAAREQALAGTRAKSDFLASMSHEMRTPLNAIIGMTSIASNSESLEKKDYCLGKIDEASKHLLGVINDILDISKIEADKFELSEQDFRFEQMLRVVVNVVEFRVDEKNQELLVRVDDAIPPLLYGDDQRIAQVVTNLLGNAVKFTPEEGTIELDAKLLEQEGDICTLQITVKDNGIGVDTNRQAQLFQSFTQEDSSTVREYGGTGLGLTISKRIVEMMDGRIWVESEKGKGSLFGITFKVKEAHKDPHGDSLSQKLSAAENNTAGSFKNHRILLAEDVDINREILLTLLEDTGVEIECADNGLQAVEMFSADPERFEMVFMDIHMPEMDGYEATRQIRALSTAWAQEVPIVAMTANVFKEDIEKCLAAGMDDHIGKPLNMDDVMTKLRQYLS